MSLEPHPSPFAVGVTRRGWIRRDCCEGLPGVGVYADWRACLCVLCIVDLPHQFASDVHL